MSFPQYGKNISAFSTLWKNIFHSVDSGGASAPTHNPKAHDLRSNIVEPVVGSLNL